MVFHKEHAVLGPYFLSDTSFSSDILSYLYIDVDNINTIVFNSNLDDSVNNEMSKNRYVFQNGVNTLSKMVLKNLDLKKKKEAQNFV